MSFDRDFEHRDRLAKVALETFAKSGYDKASINDILEKAGVSKGQFYHHFGSKKGLYLAVVDLVIARKREHFENNPVPDQGDFFSTLRAQVEAGLRFSRDNPEIDAFARSFLRERGKPIFAAVLKDRTLQGTDPLGPLVERYFARGAFHPSVSLAFARRAVTMVFDNAIRLLDLGRPEDLSQRLDELIAFLRRGIGRERE